MCSEARGTEGGAGMRGQMGGITAEALFLCQKQTLKSKATAKGSLQ